MPKTSTPTTEPDEDAPRDDATTSEATPDETTEGESPKPKAKAARGAGDEHPFFTWIRNLDLKREAGWIGGVSAGIGTKLGIDPLIVRGILVVLAVLGAPAILAYAAAWLLLPDRSGQIHLQELLRGHVTPALPAIVGLIILSFLPFAQGFWYLGGLYWGAPDVVGAIARALWMAVVLAVLIIVVVWLARRASGDVTTMPATTDDRPDTVPAAPSASAAYVAEPTLPGEPPAPPVPPAGASDADLAAWKDSQADWQQQRAAWVTEQQRTDAELRQTEKRARAEEWAAALAERQRIRRLTRPRASAAAVWTIIGLSLLAGAVGAFFALSRPDLASSAWAIGISIGTIVIGLGAVIVGLARRRSGFLAFLGIVGVLSTVTVLLLPVGRVLLPEGVSYGIPLEDGNYARLAGTTSIAVEELPGDAPTIELWQATGDLVIDLEDGTAVRLESVTATGDVYVQYFVEGEFVDEERPAESNGDGEQYLSTTLGGGSPDAVVRVWLGTGSVWVNVNDEGN